MAKAGENSGEEEIVAEVSAGAPQNTSAHIPCQAMPPIQEDLVMLLTYNQGHSVFTDDDETWGKFNLLFIQSIFGHRKFLINPSATVDIKKRFDLLVTSGTQTFLKGVILSTPKP